MDIVRNATGHGPSASPDASVEAELASLVDVYGLAILQVPDQIKLRLAQACPGAQRQIDAVLSALAADVPQRLRKAHDDERLQGLLQQLVQRVEDHGSLDAATASWAVRAWAHALALPTESLAKPTSPQEPSMAREFAAVVTPLSRKPPPAVGTDRPDRGTEAQTPDAVSEQIASESTVQAGSVPEVVATPPIKAPIAADASSTIAEPAGPSPEAGSIDTPDVQPKADAVDPIVEPAVGAPPIVVPAAAPAWTAYSTVAENATASGMAADAVESDGPLPPEPPRTPRAPTGRRTLVIAAALAVIALAIFFGVDGTRWLSSGTTSVQTRAQPSTQPPLQPPTQRDTSVADATPRETQPAPAAPAIPPAREQSISNAPAPAPAQSTAGGNQAVPVETAPTAPPAAVVREAEPRAPASSRPSSASSDAQRPTITHVDVPRVIVGAPFTVAIRVDKGTSDIASVERKVIDGSAVRPRTGTVTPSTGLRRSRSGAYLIPFKAIDAPSYATIEFTAIDRNGARSAPKRAILAVAAAPAVATSNCTRTTCGTVVAIREFDAGPIGRSSDRTPRTYEVIVRMDDRTIHKATVTEYWSTGTWVQMVGGRFVSMKSGPR